MRDKHCKKLQSYVNKTIKEMNKQIYNDDLWLGRFYAHQTRHRYHKFPDSSGGILSVWIECVDKKTNMRKTAILDTHRTNNPLFNWDLFWVMNNFINEDVDVWRKENPYKDKKIDYRLEKK